MHIESITLKNFKKFTSKTIKFHQGLSLLVGGNNEGKSTILHALAVWEFCKTFLVINKGQGALQDMQHIDGVGLNIDEFTPINIPDLKYLWPNLKPGGGYNLSIRCDWKINNESKHLEISLALANDRLFVKTTDSNINTDDKIPVIAYLPPFAGILDKELWQYTAQRKKLIGQGLAGAVLQNTIIDMYINNQTKRKELKGDRPKIKNSDLATLRTTDPYEQLNAVLREIFNCELFPEKFNSDFHQYVHVNIKKGSHDVNGGFNLFPNYKARDIMTEGSGFLQWLSVYTYALNEEIDVLLLDEPDAHLHCSLQMLLVSKLQNFIEKNNKQILIATHSTEIIKNTPFNLIIDVNNRSCKYLGEPSQIVSILTGLGSEYNPMLASVVRTKNILFVENESDATLLKIFANTLEIEWPHNITIWPTASKHDFRSHVIAALEVHVKDLSAMSLIDKDQSDYNNVDNRLRDKSFADKSQDVEPGRTKIYARFRKWRRSEIENYLINCAVLARAAKISEEDVQTFFSEHALVIPDTNTMKQSDMQNNTIPFFNLSGKEYIELFCMGRGIDKYDIAKEFTKDEICDDIKTILTEIQDMCK